MTCCLSSAQGTTSFVVDEAFSVLTSCISQVISGQQLPKVKAKKTSIVDPVVRVEVQGVPADVAVKETACIDNNGTVACQLADC